jgi:hypothetical protein
MWRSYSWLEWRCGVTWARSYHSGTSSTAQSIYYLSEIVPLSLVPRVLHNLYINWVRLCPSGASSTAQSIYYLSEIVPLPLVPRVLHNLYINQVRLCPSGASSTAQSIHYPSEIVPLWCLEYCITWMSLVPPGALWTVFSPSDCLSVNLSNI